jgi:hypothetical protein
MRKQKGGAQRRGGDSGAPKVDAVEQSRSSKTSAKPTQAYVPWRKRLPIHPAANKYPLFSSEELLETGDDIKQNGLRLPAVVEETADGWRLVDGRNRLDAMEAVGIDVVFDDTMFEKLPPGTDADAYIASLNLHRRMLTQEDKQKRLAALIKAHPEKSDRQIAKQTGVSNTHVGKVRKELEKSGDVSTVDTRTDTKGRQQPATKPPKPVAVKKSTVPPPKVEVALAIPQPEKNWKAGMAETVALTDFAMFTLANIKSGHLKISADVSIPDSQDRYRKWRDLKDRVQALVKAS